jgi:hypothetical protein
MLIEYVDANNTEKSGDIVLSTVTANTMLHKIEFEFDPKSKLVESYREYLEDTKQSASEMTMLQYLLSDSDVIATVGSELGFAAWNGVAKTNFSAGEKRAIRKRINGFVQEARQSVIDGTGAQVIPTGALGDNTMTAQLTSLYQRIPQAIRKKPLALIMCDNKNDAYDTNYQTVFQRNALSKIDIGGKGIVKGRNFHLGNDRHFTVPHTEWNAPNGVMITPLDNLEYLRNETNALESMECQKIKHVAWFSAVINAGFRIVNPKLVVMNDQLFANT